MILLSGQRNLSYVCTNENLDAIVQGLDVSRKDRVLCVGGSGDQAFALLEHCKVSAVDNDPVQVRHINKRREFLSKGEYDRFLEIPLNLALFTRFFNCLYCYLEQRNSYFRSGDRLDKIRKRLKKLKIFRGDIFDAVRKENFTRLYLSNALQYYTKSGSEELSEFLRNLSLNLSLNCLVYVANHNSIANFLPFELKLDESLTSRAREYQHGRWRPGVYRKVYPEF